MWSKPCLRHLLYPEPQHPSICSHLAILSSTFDSWLTERDSSPTAAIQLFDPMWMWGFPFFCPSTHQVPHPKRKWWRKKIKNKKISQSAEQRWHIKLRRYYSSHDVSEAAVSWWQASLRTAWVECISAPSKNPPYNLLGAMGDILAVSEGTTEGTVQHFRKRFCFVWAAF